MKKPISYSVSRRKTAGAAQGPLCQAGTAQGPSPTMPMMPPSCRDNPLWLSGTGMAWVIRAGTGAVPYDAHDASVM